jgi:hypothetical protein
MNAKPTLARPRVVTTIAAAALSTVIATGLLTAVTGLFQHDGAPFEQVVIAEHACANHTFISEREACVRLYLAAACAKRCESLKLCAGIRPANGRFRRLGGMAAFGSPIADGRRSTPCR